MTLTACSGCDGTSTWKNSMWVVPHTTGSQAHGSSGMPCQRVLSSPKMQRFAAHRSPRCTYTENVGNGSSAFFRLSSSCTAYGHARGAVAENWRAAIEGVRRREVLLVAAKGAGYEQGEPGVCSASGRPSRQSSATAWQRRSTLHHPPRASGDDARS